VISLFVELVLFSSIGMSQTSWLGKTVTYSNSTSNDGQNTISPLVVPAEGYRFSDSSGGRCLLKLDPNKTVSKDPENTSTISSFDQFVIMKVDNHNSLEGKTNSKVVYMTSTNGGNSYILTCSIKEMGTILGAVTKQTANKLLDDFFSDRFNAVTVQAQAAVPAPTPTGGMGTVPSLTAEASDGSY
jgi:hypothetical protein